MGASVLQVTGLAGGYPRTPVLRGLSFTLPPGQITVLAGPNGSGKTTLIHILAGHLPVTGGGILLDGRDITALPAHRRARAGIGLVPQGRRLFADLTVAEHLTLAAAHRGDIGLILDLLPNLATRLHHRPDQLSGGEQQMLAIARGLLTRPSLLLLDEPFEGLAAPVAATISSLLSRLAGDGTTILVTDANPAAAGAIGYRLLLHRGQLATEP